MDPQNWRNRIWCEPIYYSSSKHFKWHSTIGGCKNIVLLKPNPYKI